MAERVHPLASVALAASDCGAAQLALVPPMRRLIVRGDPTELAAAGFPVPGICRALTIDDGTVLWLGPDEFLLLGSTSAAPPSAAVIDVSHRDLAVAVSGPRAEWVINAFCALDLHPTAFAVGTCTRTVFGKAEIVLWRMAPDTFRVEVARSFAPYVWACLEEARREFLA